MRTETVKTIWTVMKLKIDEQRAQYVTTFDTWQDCDSFCCWKNKRPLSLDDEDTLYFYFYIKGELKNGN